MNIMKCNENNNNDNNNENEKWNKIIMKMKWK